MTNKNPKAVRGKRSEVVEGWVNKGWKINRKGIMCKELPTLYRWKEDAIYEPRKMRITATEV